MATLPSTGGIRLCLARLISVRPSNCYAACLKQRLLLHPCSGLPTALGILLLRCTWQMRGIHLILMGCLRTEPCAYLLACCCSTQSGQGTARLAIC